MYMDVLSLEKFWEELKVWSERTFGSDQIRGPQGPLKHLAKEVQECLANPQDIEEFADIGFLWFDSARRAGFSLDDLKKAITAKLLKNQQRTWGPPSLDEPVEHIR